MLRKLAGSAFGPGVGCGVRRRLRLRARFPHRTLRRNRRRLGRDRGCAGTRCRGRGFRRRWAGARADAAGGGCERWGRASRARDRRGRGAVAVWRRFMRGGGVCGHFGKTSVCGTVRFRGDCAARGKSKRDSSTACPGASRKRKGAGHSARNDKVNGGAISSGGGWRRRKAPA